MALVNDENVRDAIDKIDGILVSKSSMKPVKQRRVKTISFSHGLGAFIIDIWHV